MTQSQGESPRVKRPAKNVFQTWNRMPNTRQQKVGQPKSPELGVVSFVQIVHGSLVTAIELVVWEVAFRGPQS